MALYSSELCLLFPFESRHFSNIVYALAQAPFDRVPWYELGTYPVITMGHIVIGTYSLSLP